MVYSLQNQQKLNHYYHLLKNKHITILKNRVHRCYLNYPQLEELGKQSHTHFGIGFGWYMYLAGNTEIQSYVVGILVGLFFVFAAWFLYKKAYQLQQVNRTEQTDQLVGRECTIYFKQSDSKYTVQTNRDGAMREVDVISESGKAYQTGDRTVITRYQDGTLYIQ